ncbi:unnamed protein product [Effrenium voratum]|nr:unnamed protein product [Effrenium voratum]
MAYVGLVGDVFGKAYCLGHKVGRPMIQLPGLPLVSVKREEGCSLDEPGSPDHMEIWQRSHTFQVPGSLRSFSAPSILQTAACSTCGKTGLGLRLKTCKLCKAAHQRKRNKQVAQMTWADFPKRACAQGPHAHASVTSFVRCEYHRTETCNVKSCKSCHCGEQSKALNTWEEFERLHKAVAKAVQMRSDVPQ